MSDNDKIWQGGNTNLSIKYDKMIRQSEDFIDELDCESYTRESLVKMREMKNKEGRVKKGRVERLEDSDE